MFDANASHIRAGKEFFAEVHACTKDSVLYPLGIRRGDVLLCTMMEETSDNPLVRFHLDESVEDLRVDVGLYDWLSYLGRPDGGGFSNDECKAKAKNLIGDWYGV